MEGNPKKKPRIGRRSHDVGVAIEEQTDRLSDLPDNIINHILSFLDSKLAVQTSLLSKRWRCLWKDLHVLNFRRNSFRKKSSFVNHIRDFLSLRSSSAVVDTVAFDFGSGFCGGSDIFRTVMNYASAAAHSGGGLRDLSIIHSGDRFDKLCDVFSLITSNHHYESLKVLEFDGILVDSTALSALGFKLLTNLELHSCNVIWGLDDVANLPPCLKYLKLLNCSSASRFKISAPQLLDLEIREVGIRGIEVFAPKLKSFHLWVRISDLQISCNLNFPVLDHANIRLWCECEDLIGFDELDDLCISEIVACGYMNLLSGLHNAESLVMHYDKLQNPELWNQHHFFFDELKMLMESKASPFTRLKTLRMQFPQEPPSVPYQVIRYFFEKSSSTEGQSVKFERKI